MISRSRYVAPTMVVVLVAGALTVSGLTVPAWGNDGTSVRSGDDPRAVALLAQAMEAPKRVSYAGTQYVGAWSALDRAASTSAVVDVRHIAGGPTVVDGRDAGRLSLSSSNASGTWLAGAGGPIGLLVKAYDVRITRQAEVAGRTVDVVEARRPDGSAAARLWVDNEHALALRREVYDDQGRTLSASAFVEIALVAASRPRISSNISRALSVTDMNPGGVPLSQADLDRLRENGWLCPGALNGSLVLYQAYRHGEAVQLSYSDGLATLSVFEQPGHLDPAILDGFTARDVDDGVVYAKPGPPSQFTWVTGDDRVITVVTDGPVGDVAAVVAALPPAEAGQLGGVFDRISRGAQRLVSLVNPFD